MSDAKFTPGPWRIGKCGPNKCPPIGNMKGLMVAMCSHSTDDHPEIATANASLIAAAPDLYDALSKAVNRLKMDMDDGSRPDYWSMEAIVEPAIKALSKARGE